MEDRRTISEYVGIQKDVTFSLETYFSFSICNQSFAKKHRQSLGLVNIAHAISLCDWDGVMPGPVSLTLVINIYRQVDFPLHTQSNKYATGLRMSKGEVVTVGRIVNDEWYQGFNNKDVYGYFPRAFVSVRK